MQLKTKLSVVKNRRKHMNEMFKSMPLLKRFWVFNNLRNKYASSHMHAVRCAIRHAGSNCLRYIELLAALSFLNAVLKPAAVVLFSRYGKRAWTNAGVLCCASRTVRPATRLLRF